MNTVTTFHKEMNFIQIHNGNIVQDCPRWLLDLFKHECSPFKAVLDEIQPGMRINISIRLTVEGQG